MSSIKIGLRTQKTKSNPWGYEAIENIPSDEVCVLFLNGDGATDDKSANGAAKIIEEQVLDTIGEKVSVYSTNYDFEGVHGELSRLLDFAKYGHMQYSQIDKLSKAKAEDYDPQYVNDLFKRAILPRISLINGKGKLSTEEACKRIRKLNIVAFCHGAHVALKLEEKMQLREQLNCSLSHVFNQGQMPRSFLASTTRLTAIRYAPVRKVTFFSWEMSQTPLNAREIIS